MTSSTPLTGQVPPTQVGAVVPADPGVGSDLRTPNEFRHDTPVRGDAVLAAGERVWMQVERVLGLGLPQQWNPMAYTGALSGYTFIIATVTGILLLFWYDSSVNSAHASVAAMQAQPWGGGFVRALHRYSSDACVLFAVIHAVKVFLTRRFTGARWVAWVTGIIIIFLIWLDGWLGYWLVWDERGKAVAVGTAHLLDALPIFSEPVAASFLTNDSINSLIFFAVFFAHMLLPIPIGVMIWIHLARLKKPRFLPTRKLALVTLAVLVVVSLVVPASLAAPADMAVLKAEFDIDWFYLLPLFLTDRLDSVSLWAIFLVSFTLFCMLPFVLARKRRKPALVNQDICSGCTQCAQDCPYEAITMLPRGDRELPPSPKAADVSEPRKALLIGGTGPGSEIDLVALVDPNRCVSCGVCVGSCDPGAMGYEELQRRAVRDRITRWLDAAEGPKAIAFLCADGAGKAVRFDAQSGLSKELPGWRVIGVPCAAWVHSSLIELIGRKGGRAMVVACEGPEPRCRLGTEIAIERAENRRHPEFKPERIPEGTFRLVALQSGDLPSLQQVAEDMREGAYRTRQTGPSRAGLVLTGVLAVLLLTTATVGFSRFVYVAPAKPESMLVVSFKHAGAEIVDAGEVDSELSHLKGMKRRAPRQPVRLRVRINGETVHEQAYKARGLRGAGASSATVEFAMQAGVHDIEIALGESADAEEWTHIERGQIEFTAGRRRVVQFDGSYRWDGTP